jgi:glutaminyl-tRNA synthetase
MADNLKDNEPTGKELLGRELPSGVNSQALLDAHKKINKNNTVTRFPPEPNGFLHVGHAKSMNMNFSLAFHKLGIPEEDRQTVFRYDDTNPEAESEVYIKSLREDVDWLGWKPAKVTFTSDYFVQLYSLAVDLIQRGKAYVCHQSKLEIEACREIAKAMVADPSIEVNFNYVVGRDSPYRVSILKYSAYTISNKDTI